MKKITLLIIIASIGLVSQAQERSERFDEMLKEFQKERISYLTREMELTVDEAEVFWPIYNEYLSKRDTIIRRYRPPRTFRQGESKNRPRGMNYDDLSVSQADSMVFGQINQELELIHLKKEYFEKIRNEMPAKKVAILYRAEQRFMNYMIDKMRGDHRGRSNQRDRMD